MLSPSLNPDRATLNFLNAYAEDVRNEGEKLQKEGAVETTAADPEKIDRLDYFFASCKRRGIYITLDLYTSRQLKKGEIRKFPDRSVSGRDFKALALIDEEVMQNLERFAGNLLTHTNPYTNLRWADDPALATVSIINEGTLSNNLRSSYVRKVYDDAFRKFRSESDENRTVDRREFERRVYANAYSRYSSRLRKWGVKVPLTDLNYIMDPQSNLCRSVLDYVDLHYYWAHPTSNMPRNASPEDALGALGGISLLFPHRAFGRPFAITEWNYVFPNAYRAEGGFLAGAYAALQNYAMLCQFDYASNPVRSIRPAHIVGFELANDPIARLTNLAGALFFLRGDVSPSPITLAFAPDVPEQTVSRMALLSRVGLCWNSVPGVNAEIISRSRKAKTAAPSFIAERTSSLVRKLAASGILPAGTSDFSQNQVCSVTGELQLDAERQIFQMVTPRSESILASAKTERTGKILTVRIQDAFAAISLASMDGKPLSQSRRMLLLHLTENKSEGAVFRDSSMSVQEKSGSSKQLLRRNRADVLLKLKDKFRVFACTGTGKRLFEVPVKPEKEGFLLALDNASAPGGVLLYELLREEPARHK